MKITRTIEIATTGVRVEYLSAPDLAVTLSDVNLEALLLAIVDHVPYESVLGLYDNETIREYLND